MLPIFLSLTEHYSPIHGNTIALHLCRTLITGQPRVVSSNATKPHIILSISLFLTSTDGVNRTRAFLPIRLLHLESSRETHCLSATRHLMIFVEPSVSVWTWHGSMPKTFRCQKVFP